MDVKISVGAAIIILIIAGFLVLQKTPQEKGEIIRIHSKITCEAGERTGYECINNETLRWYECLNNELVNKTMNCRSLDRPGFIGYCTTHFKTVQGERAGCAIKPISTAFTPSPTTPGITPTVSITPSPTIYKNYTMYCGDGICDPNEGCNTCPQDCRCTSSQYCADNGVCYQKVLCGDNKCDESEKESCCLDCGCKNGNICNDFTGKCQAPITIAQEILNNIISNYSSEGEYIGMVDTYSGNESVKELMFNCTTEGEFVAPCEIFVFVYKNGTTEEMRTV